MSLRHGVCQADPCGMHGNPGYQGRVSPDLSLCGCEEGPERWHSRGHSVTATAGRHLGGRRPGCWGRLLADPAARHGMIPMETDGPASPRLAAVPIGSWGGRSFVLFKEPMCRTASFAGRLQPRSPAFSEEAASCGGQSQGGLQAATGMLGPGWSLPPPTVGTRRLPRLPWRGVEGWEAKA